MTESIDFNQLEKELNKRENYAEIKKAYEFALEQHQGMKRLTGDDFITHPLAVVKILMELNVDDTTIIAALLHETMMNGTATYDVLEENFGTDVAKIVESITKINNLDLPGKNDNSAIYLRNILVGLTEDVRTLYIKLADRLHNMRTYWAVDEEKRKEKAEETLDVLVPIAHRLGINSIKSELENLSLYYLKPDVYNDILEKLNDTVSSLNDYLDDMKQELIDILTEAGIKFKIKGRVKSVYSIYNKLNNGKKWDQIYDILALRIFVEKESECYAVVGLIHAHFRPVPNRFKDYIANPKENMYQSLHTTVFGVSDKIFEVQIRTYEMDEIAEKGIASHWSYKEKGVKKVQKLMEQKLELFRSIIDTNASETDDTFKEAINRSIFSKNIYVYTPKGDVMELPQGSTPIDFAYRIHSKVGDTMVGAIVNDQMVPINTELQNDDIVKIMTNSSSTPNIDWLNIVKTNQARDKIKAFFSKKDKEEYIAKGKDILEKELRKRKLSFNTIFNNEAIKKVLHDLKFEDIDELYMALGSLRFTPGYVINLVDTDKDRVEDILIEKRPQPIKVNYKSDVYVDGLDNILVNMAKCCMPVKGDKIVGYITKGQGITVHKENCPNVNLTDERLIKVTWNENSTNNFYTNIYVKVNENKNIMAELITEIGKKEAYVRSCNTIEKENYLVYVLNIRIRNTEMLEQVINSVAKMPYVAAVSQNI